MSFYKLLITLHYYNYEQLCFTLGSIKIDDIFKQIIIIGLHFISLASAKTHIKKR
jgi:hypothetical protein